MPKIHVKANPKCKNCLGAGWAATLYAGVNQICSCVTEQLEIEVVPKDYKIPADERYQPGLPDFVTPDGQPVQIVEA